MMEDPYASHAHNENQEISLVEKIFILPSNSTWIILKWRVIPGEYFKNINDHVCTLWKVT